MSGFIPALHHPAHFLQHKQVDVADQILPLQISHKRGRGNNPLFLVVIADQRLSSRQTAAV